MTNGLRRDGVAALVSVASASMTGVVLAGEPPIVRTLDALQDNTLYEFEDGIASNGAGDHFFAGNTIQTDTSIRKRRGLIQFDFSSLPDGAVITDVSLTLHMSRTIAGTRPVTMHRASQAWGEAGSDAPGQEGGGAPAQTGDATWTDAILGTSQWETPGGDFVAMPSASAMVGGVGFYTWSGAGLVADVQAFVDGTSDNFGWLLLGDEENAPTAKRFDSRENPNEAFRPVLEVSFIPAPGAAGMLAVAGLMLNRRRR